MSITGRIIKKVAIKFVVEESVNLLGLVRDKSTKIDTGIDKVVKDVGEEVVGYITKIHWSSLMTILLLKFMNLVGIKLPKEKK